MLNSQPSVADDPLVSIILPIRNEARCIARCLEAVLMQDYPRDRIEILVVDGMSDDGTREIVARFAAQHPGVQLIDNPQRIVPTALNRAIRLARGSIIIRVDGHTVIAPDYVRRCVEALGSTKADNVGGPMNAVGQSVVAQAIALASSSRFGVGSALFHYADKPGWTDTVYMGAYRREVFDRIGLFDEELVRNQDDEFNFRLIRAGGKIWLDPQVRSVYYSRSTLRGAWKQYLGYGFWKVRVILKHGRPASWRHLVPATFVLALFVSFLVSLLTQSPVGVLAVFLPYATAAFAVSLWLGAHRGWRYVPILPLAFGTLHFAYGIGFLTGLARFGLFQPKRRLNKIEPNSDVERLHSHAELEKSP